MMFPVRSFLRSALFNFILHPDPDLIYYRDLIDSMDTKISIGKWLTSWFLQIILASAIPEGKFQRPAARMFITASCLIPRPLPTSYFEPS